MSDRVRVLCRVPTCPGFACDCATAEIERLEQAHHEAFENWGKELDGHMATEVERGELRDALRAICDAAPNEVRLEIRDARALLEDSDG